MVETDTDNSIDIYRYDALKGEMTRVSVDTAGVGGNTDFSDAELGFRNAISNNGQQIVFTTNEALSPEDGNGGPDAYLWQDGHTSLISTGAVGGGAGAVIHRRVRPGHLHNEQSAAHGERHRRSLRRV